MELFESAFHEALEGFLPFLWQTGRRNDVLLGGVFATLLPEVELSVAVELSQRPRPALPIQVRIRQAMNRWLLGSHQANSLVGSGSRRQKPSCRKMSATCRRLLPSDAQLGVYGPSRVGTLPQPRFLWTSRSV